MSVLSWNKIRILQIRSHALDFLYREFNGTEFENKNTVRFYYYGIAFITASILTILNFKIDKDSSTYLITGISIFAGLFFNLLIVVSDKMNKRKKLLLSAKAEDVTYAQLYKKFSEQLVAYISYAIILSLCIIILMFISQFNFHSLFPAINVDIKPYISTFNYFICFINFMIFFLGYQFLMIIIIILSNMYVMIIDDIQLDEEQDTNS